MRDPVSIGPEANGATATYADAPAPAPPTCEPSDAENAFTGQRRVTVTIPLRTSSIGNKREHPLARARRVRQEIGAVLSALDGHAPPPLPVTIEIHRVGWNRLDPLDGLPSSVKAPLDALARWFGCDDRDPRLHLRLSQSVTRETRVERDRRGNRRTVAAAWIAIGVREWRPSDGDDALRVLASPTRATP